MAKSTTKELEKSVLEETAQMEQVQEKARESQQAQAQEPDDYNIRKNQPLPDGFVNPPLGEEGHYCLDRSGNYQPEWSQLIIFKNRDKQADPVTFPLMGNRYAVPLDTWVDAPPEVLISLTDAIEIEHRSNFNDDMVRLGEEVKTSEIKRRRFFWESKPSA